MQRSFTNFVENYATLFQHSFDSSPVLLSMLSDCKEFLSSHPKDVEQIFQISEAIEQHLSFLPNLTDIDCLKNGH